MGGTIKAKSNLPIYSGRGNVTIAGQTAPGGGIMIKNGSLSIHADNVIVRHIRFRMGSGTNRENGHNVDGIRIRSNESQGLKNVIIDHCSVAWALDENISVINAKNITVQNSILAEAPKAFLMQKAKKVSVLNNLFVLNKARNVTANTAGHTDLVFEQINNIVYGFNWGTAPTEGMAFSVIKNIYEKSNDFSPSTNYPVTLTEPNPSNNDNGNIRTTHAYLEGNIINSDFFNVYRNEIKPYIVSSPKSKSSYRATGVNGLEGKLLPTIGASVPKRDAVDSRLINNYKNLNGTLRTTGSYPNISNGSSYNDSDGDGMADDWEKSYGLNPNDKSDGNKDNNKDGYTNLEDFLHYLANK